MAHMRITNRQPDSHIQYIDRQVEKEVIKEVASEPIILKQEVDLSEIHEKFENHAEHISKQKQHIDALQEWFYRVSGELEMQRRALVGLKAQRDIDRSRRLMFIRRVKKEQKARQAAELKLKLALAASLTISIISLLVKF